MVRITVRTMFMKNLKEIIKVVWLPVVLSSLCCLSSVILVLLGLSSVSFAASLSDTLYGEYKWAFRGAGLLLLAAAAVYYLRKQKGVCTLDQAKRRRNEIINFLLAVLLAGVLGYIFFLYVVVELAGKVLKIW